jgi:hypothetical protein
LILKKSCKSLIGAPSLLDHSKWIQNEEDMGLQTRKGFKKLFQNI